MSGSVTKYETGTGKERWQVRWDLPPAPDGSRRQRKKRGFKKKGEADDFLHDVMHHQRNMGQLSERSDVSLADYASAWLASRRDLAETTRDNYRVNIEVHISPRLGGLLVQDVTARHVARLYASVAEHGKRNGPCRTAGVTCREHDCSPDEHDGLAPKSVGHVHTALRAVLSQAVEDGVLASNPCDAKRAKQARSKESQQSGTSKVDEDQVWTADQVRVFLATVGDEQDAALYSLAFATGLRRGELIGLRWKDVDLDEEAGEVRVRRSVTEVRGRPVVTDGKSENARREVRVGANVVRMLRSHKAAQSAVRLRAGEEWEDTDAVFTDDSGAILRPSTVSERFTRAADRADVPTITLHDARHTHATALLRDGVPLTAIAARLGHADPSITLTTYSHLMPGDDERASDAVERLMFA